MGEQTGRNTNDVVMELLKLHINIIPTNRTEEELERLYLKYDKLVRENM